MRKNFKLFFFLILIFFNIQINLKSDDFYFEGQEIQILNTIMDLKIIYYLKVSIMKIQN